jgi:periplasmic protein TonB
VIDRRILICAALSIVGHYAIGEALSTLPPREAPQLQRKVEVTVVTPPAPVAPEPPPPEPPKPPEPPPPVPPPPTPKPVAKPKAVAQAPVAVAEPLPATAEPVPGAVVQAPGAAQPVFGVTMESTSTAGKATAPVGNTTAPSAGAGTPTGEAKGVAVAAAAEVTKMPLPKGSCAAKYTPELQASGLEGTVVLELIVDEQGNARDVKVVDGVSGLNEAAIATLKACRFTPGERNGAAVPVRIRSFKVRFVLPDAQ